MPQVDVPDSEYEGPVSPAVRKITGGVDEYYDAHTFVDKNNTHTPRSTNPKDRIGITKPPLHLVPPVAIIHEAMAFKDGAEKYGPYNWRGESVSASVYIAATLRHIFSWNDGEAISQDSRVHHLGHARACLAILLDAESVGKLIDDRPPPGFASTLLTLMTTSKKGNDNDG